jgi:hypothetical protein
MSLDDGALLLLAVHYHDSRRQVKELEEKLDGLRDEILVELEARDGRLDLDGWKVARVVNDRVSYDFDLAKAGWRPSVLRRVMVRLVDKAKVVEEIDAGRLGVLEAKAAAIVMTSAAYLRVTPPKPVESKPKAA